MAATACTWAAEHNIPVLTATTGNVSSKSSSWSQTSSTGSGWTVLTTLAVSDTTQVRAVRPWTPKYWNVLRSAWMPAPAEQSDPAIVRATGSAFIGAIDSATRSPPATFFARMAGTRDGAQASARHLNSGTNLTR